MNEEIKKDVRKKIDFKRVNSVVKLSEGILKVLYVLLIVVAIYAIALINKEVGILAFFVKLLKILSPFFVGLVIAYLFSPIVKMLQKKKINRFLGAAIVYIGLLLIIYIIIMSLIPIIGTQLNDLLTMLPSLFNSSANFITGLFEKLPEFGLDYSLMKADILSSVEAYITSISVNLPTIFINSISGMVSAIGSIGLGLVIGFFMLLDFDSLCNFMISIIPKRYKNETVRLCRLLDESFMAFIKGTLLSSLIIFVTCSVAFGVAGLKAPVLFALFCAVTNIIPYLGPYLGAAPAIIVGFSQGFGIGIAIVIIILVIQMVEGNILHPLIMSKSLDLHPVTVIISLLIFEYFFGIFGMIIATPLVAMLKTIYNFFDEKYDFFKYNNVN